MLFHRSVRLSAPLRRLFFGEFEISERDGRPVGRETFRDGGADAPRNRQSLRNFAAEFCFHWPILTNQ